MKDVEAFFVALINILLELEAGHAGKSQPKLARQNTGLVWLTLNTNNQRKPPRIQNILDLQIHSTANLRRII